MSGSCAGGCEANREPIAHEDGGDPFAWFAAMLPNCLEYAKKAKVEGRPIVGITCEYTPRELIIAAGAVPVCLCGGSADTIPAAERDLPSNLCPLVRSTYGYHGEKGNPFLEMADLLVVETTCDGKKKMYELMAESRPVHLIELPQKAEDDAAFEHWVSELRTLAAVLAAKLASSPSQDGIESAIRAMNRERSLRRVLAALMQSDAPPLTGRQLLDCRSIISGVPMALKQYERTLDMLRGREARGETDSRVRVLMTGVPIVRGAERVVDIVEGAGGLVVCMENCTGLKPILDDVAEGTPDPLQAIAEKYFALPCSVMTPNERRRTTLRQLAEKYRPQCVIELIWQACLTYDVESFFIRRLAEEELGIPYLRIETDYSPSDSARIETRVQALFETVRSRSLAETREG